MATLLRSLPLRWIAAGMLLTGLGSVYAAPAKHALLIGINQYASPQLTPLNGPRNDIELVRHVLMTRFELGNDDIVTLVDAAATHTGIQKAFADLAARTGPGDFVYIQFSGHGSTHGDPSDPTGVDQTWVPFGARMGKVAPDDLDILDKEIDSWLQPIYAKTADVVFVSDSCYSATVSRDIKGAGTGIRQAPRDPRPYPADRLPLVVGSDRPGVRIGAARDYEPAAEFNVDTGFPCSDSVKCDGAFTWNWVKALQLVTPGERWLDTFKRADVLMGTRSLQQRPQIEGHSDRLVFGGVYPPARPTIAVLSVNAATVVLDAGASSGVTEGSTYRASNDGSKDANAKDATSLVVTTVNAFTSNATVSGGKLQIGDLVVEQAHRFSSQPTHLFVSAAIHGQAEDALSGAVTNAVANVPGFDITQDIGSTDWLLNIVRPRVDAQGKVEIPPESSLPQSFAQETPEVWITDRQGQLIHDEMRISLRDQQAGLTTIQTNLQRFKHAAEVRALTSAGDKPRLSVLVTQLRPECTHDCTYLPNDVGRTRPLSDLGTRDITAPGALRCGDLLSFKIRNDAGSPYYVYLLDISADASVSAVSPRPTENSDSALLEAGQTRDTANEAVLVLPLVGTETIKLITSVAPLPLAQLFSGGYERARSSSRGLANEVADENARSGRTAPSDWGTLNYELEVAP